MKVLITGARGFIGSYLLRNLTGHDVDGTSRLELDLKNAQQAHEFFTRKYYDAVIHCASLGRNAARSYDRGIAIENLSAWTNLVANRERFGMLINLATGAEFDINQDIDCVPENAIWERETSYSYGLSKSIIAKSALTLPNFYNLRLFGCFDSSEDSRRPLKSLVTQLRKNEIFTVAGDKFFDMVSLEDLSTVIKAVLDGRIRDKDVNVVYNQKYKLSEIMKMYARIHNLNENLIQIDFSDPHNYTGDGSLLAAYKLPLLGLTLSLKKYQ